MSEHIIGRIKEVFSKIDPQQELTVEDKGLEGYMLYGPFPSFLILIPKIGGPRAVIHVNADAPNLVHIFNEFKSAGIDIGIDGAFAVDQESGNILLGQEAYTKKEDNILMFAQDILLRRKQSKQDQLFVPEEKKIILS